METQKGLHKDYSPFKGGDYMGFHVSLGSVIKRQIAHAFESLHAKKTLDLLDTLKPEALKPK